MIRPVRAAAYAAAAFALAASGLGAPASAWESNEGAVATPWFAHGAAGLETSDLGLNQAAPVPAGTLSEQVLAQAAAETSGPEEECLANAVYFEARGESLEGQLAVAEVVLNRAASGRYPASLCGVVRQPWQFSFVRGGRIPRADRGSEAWRKAVAIARIAQAGTARMLPASVLWYHADYVAPSWGRRLALNSRIGAHIFYR